MKNPEEVRQEARQHAYEQAAANLAIESALYLETGSNGQRLKDALKEFTASHYAKVAGEIEAGETP